MGVAKELERLRREKGTASLLISHEPQIVDVVMGQKEPTTLVNATQYNHDVLSGTNASLGSTTVVSLDRRESNDDGPKTKTLRHPSVFGKDAHQRFLIKLLDYFLYSLPLILLTFLAAGLEISMLSSDILHRVDVTDTVLSVVQSP